MTDYEKLFDIKNNIEETSVYFRKKKEDVLNYLIQKSEPTGKLPRELHIQRYELNTTILNDFLEKLGYSVIYEERISKEVGFYYIVNLT